MNEKFRKLDNNTNNKKEKLESKHSLFWKNYLNFLKEKKWIFFGVYWLVVVFILAILMIVDQSVHFVDNSYYVEKFSPFTIAFLSVVSFTAIWLVAYFIKKKQGNIPQADKMGDLDKNKASVKAKPVAKKKSNKK